MIARNTEHDRSDPTPDPDPDARPHPVEAMHHPAVAARRARMERQAVMQSDWQRALFIHFEVDPELLQPCVPFELDVRDGCAYVSLVAFTMARLRPVLGGRVGAVVFAPIATHELLNVRTYVHHAGEDGIYFINEWIPNRLSVLLGPPMFGLPYRLGRLDYDHRHESGTVRGVVVPRDGGRFAYRARIARPARFAPCAPGSRSEHLMEHYTAFTEWRGMRRRFRIRHEPWSQVGVAVTIDDDSALRWHGAWYRSARLVGANYTPGVLDVGMGRPHVVTTAA